jgi:hypothetical protein
MTRLLKLEEVGLFLLSILLFSQLPLAWWVYLLLFFAPDLGMIGYLAGSRIGATTYNMTHHKGLGFIFYAIGILSSIPTMALVGVIVMGHSSFDRVLGYGLKHSDSFQHTHLGWIGRSKGANAPTS